MRARSDMMTLLARTNSDDPGLQGSVDAVG